jgi:hypothetical protein
VELNSPNVALIRPLRAYRPCPELISAGVGAHDEARRKLKQMNTLLIGEIYVHIFPLMLHIGFDDDGD